MNHLPTIDFQGTFVSFRGPVRGFCVWQFQVVQYLEGLHMRRKPTNFPWKSMVGRCISYIEMVPFWGTTSLIFRWHWFPFKNWRYLVFLVYFSSTGHPWWPSDLDLSSPRFQILDLVVWQIQCLQCCQTAERRYLLIRKLTTASLANRIWWLKGT